MPKIVQDQPGEDDGKPGHADRLAAEMAHVGIERLAAGHRQEDAAEDEQRQEGPFDQHAGAIGRIEGEEDLQVVEDVIEAHHADGEKPDGGDRREQRGHARRALVLEQEEA